MDHEGGFRLGVALNSDGSIAYGSIESGGQVSLIDRTTIENSFSEISRSTLELGGGRTQFDNPEQFEQQLDRVFEGSSLYTGVITQRADAALTSLSQGLSRYFTERGQSIDASSIENVQHSFGGGGRLGVTIPRSAAPVDAGASGSVESRKFETNQRGARIDLTADYARDAVLSARASSVASIREKFGTFSSENETEVRAAILQELRVGIEQRLQRTRDDALQETLGARAGHDVEPEFAVQQREAREDSNIPGDQVSARHGIMKR
jgi:hypothetical protein